MDNVQKHNICINVPLSQSFRFVEINGKLKILIQESNLLHTTWFPGKIILIKRNAMVLFWCNIKVLKFIIMKGYVIHAHLCCNITAIQK
jgi:hypothetical protein